MLAKLPHVYSGERSEQKVIVEGKTKIKELEREIEAGLTVSRKEKLIEKVEEIEKKIKRVSGKVADTPNSNGNSKKVDILNERAYILQKADALKSEIATSRNFKVDKIPSSYPKEVKKVIQRIFEVIDRVLPEGQAQELQDRIIEELQKKTKRVQTVENKSVSYQG